MIQRASFAPNTRTVKSVAKKMNGKVSVPHVLWNEKSSAKPSAVNFKIDFKWNLNEIVTGCNDEDVK